MGADGVSYPNVNGVAGVPPYKGGKGSSIRLSCGDYSVRGMMVAGNAGNSGPGYAGADGGSVIVNGILGVSEAEPATPPEGLIRAGRGGTGGKRIRLEGGGFTPGTGGDAGDILMLHPVVEEHVRITTPEHVPVEAFLGEAAVLPPCTTGSIGWQAIGEMTGNEGGAGSIGADGISGAPDGGMGGAGGSGSAVTGSGGGTGGPGGWCCLPNSTGAGGTGGKGGNGEKGTGGNGGSGGRGGDGCPPGGGGSPGAPGVGGAVGAGIVQGRDGDPGNNGAAANGNGGSIGATGTGCCN